LKRTATIILNRNLPKVTDKLIKKITYYNKNYTDIFLVDSGSNKKLISKYTTWIFNSKKVKKFGLRFSRGMNYGLSQLYKEKKFDNYDFFFLITNDTVVKNKPFINKLENILDKNKSVGILSPCSKKWGEYYLLKKNRLKFFWYIHNNAYFLRREFIKEIMNLRNPGYMNFLFDGNNFRGYGAEIEIIAKGYKKNWASAITSEVTIEENENYLLNKNQLIKTDPYDKNIMLYLEEGKKWMKKKYGFNSKWAMQMYVKKFYDLFFKNNSNLIKFKL
jgi:hypothetical protein